MKPVIIIPAYQPGQELIDLVETIRVDNQRKIIVVDDGSTGDSKKIFEFLERYSGQVEILRHAVNLGKGQALKTGFNHFLVNYAKDCVGVITADADGQHSPDDILLVSKKLEENPGVLCLGSRKLDKDVPFRSIFGNRLTALVFRLVTGVSLIDTQSGLRGIPKFFLADILHSTEYGYDFELDMLIRAAKSHLPIMEIPIQTIYIAHNKSSHFNIFRDSLKIYFVFFRFSISSLLTAGIDYSVFSISFWYSRNIFLSIVAARSIAGVFQFTFGKIWVFKSNSKIFPELAKYVLLVIGLMLLSYGLITPLVVDFKINPYISKIIAESVIFLLSFTAQNIFVYSSKGNVSQKTDWDLYYDTPHKTSTISRKITEKKLLNLLRKFGAKKIERICELGGGNSCFFDPIRRQYPDAFYSILDNNQRGLDLFHEEHPGVEKVELLNQNILELSSAIDKKVDVAFSIGLIEHFNPTETSQIIRSHFSYVKPGGLVLITFPTPTFLYKSARGIVELLGMWRFPDERPLSIKEVVEVVAQHGEILHTSINWPIIFTQGIIVARCKDLQQS